MLFSLSTKLNLKEILNLKLFLVGCLCRADGKGALLKSCPVNQSELNGKGREVGLWPIQPCVGGLTNKNQSFLRHHSLLLWRGL